jgi:hypothetical protein
MAAKQMTTVTNKSGIVFLMLSSKSVIGVCQTARALAEFGGLHDGDVSIHQRGSLRKQQLVLKASRFQLPLNHRERTEQARCSLWFRYFAIFLSHPG